MNSLLPESPGWYRISSGIAHSAAWVLHDAVAGTSGADLALTPDLMEVAAAAESAISASALIIERHATYYGYDPEPRVRQSQQRREMLDVLMREQAIKQMTNPAPLIAAGSLCLICRRQPCVQQIDANRWLAASISGCLRPVSRVIIRSHGLERPLRIAPGSSATHSRAEMRTLPGAIVMHRPVCSLAAQSV
jgi:hypothetical protein